MEGINAGYSVNLGQQKLNQWKQSQSYSLDKTYASLKKGIWLYFYLLLFEGALRKWILPGLATPLLIVRDPVAIWLLFKALQKGLLKPNTYIIFTLIVSTAGFFTAVIFGHGNVLVALYGLRVFILHFPLIFIIGKVFNGNDVIKMGNVILIISIPMTILCGYQFFSPQSAWVNRGIGGDETGAGFSGALGYFRPPGTFSFTIGNSSFFSLVAAYVFYFWFNMKETKRLLLICSTLALIFAVPFSISRTLVFQVGISLLFSFITLLRKPNQILTFVVTSLFLIGLFLLLQDQPILATGIKVLNARFENASNTEGGVEGTIGDRFFGLMAGAIGNSSDYPYWGFGMGMGTQAGAMLLTGGHGFLIAEIEWGRLIGEMGFLLGIAAILIRVIFTAQMCVQSLQKVFKEADSLPWMLLSFGFLQIIQGQWGQPSVLGFGTLIGGLILAALKSKEIITKRV